MKDSLIAMQFLLFTYVKIEYFVDIAVLKYTVLIQKYSQDDTESYSGRDVMFVKLNLAR